MPLLSASRLAKVFWRRIFFASVGGCLSIDDSSYEAHTKREETTASDLPMIVVAVCLISHPSLERLIFSPP